MIKHLIFIFSFLFTLNNCGFQKVAFCRVNNIDYKYNNAKSVLLSVENSFNSFNAQKQLLELRDQTIREKLLRTRLITTLIVVISLMLIFILFHIIRINKTKQRSLIFEKEKDKREALLKEMEFENKLKEEEKERYRLDVELKNKELSFVTLRKANVEVMNQSVKERLIPFAYRFSRKKDREDFIAALNEITLNVNHDPLSDFEKMFVEMHQGFYDKLLSITSELSPGELQMCALLRMNLPSKEMASLLNLSLSTIDQRRHAIRKKLNLNCGDNLTSYLIGI